jgi:hypothetical protein
MAEKDLLLVKSIGSVVENQPTPPTFDVESLHMHAITIDPTVRTDFFVVATRFVELEIQ